MAVDILHWQKGHVDSGLFLVSDADYWGLIGDGAYVTKYAAPWLQGFMKQNVPDMEGQWRMRHLPKWSPDSPKTLALWRHWHGHHRGFGKQARIL